MGRRTIRPLLSKLNRASQLGSLPIDHLITTGPMDKDLPIITLLILQCCKSCLRIALCVYIKATFSLVLKTYGNSLHIDHIRREIAI